MMYKVEIHLDNKGVLTHFANVEDPIDWLLAIHSEEVYVGKDRISNKHFSIVVPKVTSILIEKLEGDDAIEEGQEPEDD